MKASFDAPLSPLKSPSFSDSLRPAVNSNSWVQAVVFGALFGFFTYATYDLTNLATIKDWPFVVVVVDIVWGVCLCTLTALSSYSIARWLM